jgi:hypothetical protein
METTGAGEKSAEELLTEVSENSASDGATQAIEEEDHSGSLIYL